MRIDNQKQLEQVLRERDERLKARANVNVKVKTLKNVKVKTL